MSNLNVKQPKQPRPQPETANATAGRAYPYDTSAPADAKDSRPTGLQCTTDKHGGLVVVQVVGDVDLATADVLWGELSAQLVPGSAVVLECTGITFIDSMGLQVLLRTNRYASEQSASFGLIGTNQYVDRVLELSGLIGLLPRFADIETAQAELSLDVD
jgi:anti-anti-sigma factor